MTILVTGAAGFIGSNFVLGWLDRHDEPVVSLDALTYAGNLSNLSRVLDDPRHSFIRGSINDASLIGEVLNRHQVRAIINFAAESHVDRSIDGPLAFVDTNIVGTAVLLEAARAHLLGLESAKRDEFRFVHISTDEVYGSLSTNAPAFTEEHPFLPNSPYAASKAASDHLVRAYFETYGLPALTTNCSNNFGPFQFPEKLIPLIIHNAVSGKPLPIYGDGLQVRDWLYVGDHCRAIELVMAKGKPGETYNVGGGNELTNIALVERICATLDAMRPRSDGKSYTDQISHVQDRAGHDRRYAVNSAKIRTTMQWAPAQDFDAALSDTIAWYLENPDWLSNAAGQDYKNWIDKKYA